MDEVTKKARMYGGSGLNETLEAKPLQVEETHHNHTATVTTPCHDCGRKIAAGSPMVVQRLTVSQGVNAQNFAYTLHPTCYRVLGQTVRVVPTHASHLFGVGRKSLRVMWAENAALITNSHPELAAILASAFPLPK